MLVDLVCGADGTDTMFDELVVVIDVGAPVDTTAGETSSSGGSSSRKRFSSPPMW